MASEDKPQGGVHLSAGFGEASRAPRPAGAAEIAFILTIVGDFGGAGAGRCVDVSAHDLSAFMASFGAVVELEVPNRLGSAPPALAIRLPITSIRDLDPKTIARRIPQIADAERLVAAFQSAKSASEIGALAEGRGLDRVAALQAASTRSAGSPEPSQPPAGEEEASLDRLLQMVDIQAPAADADPAKAAVSAFVSSLAKSRQPAAAPQAADRLLAEQARDVSTHPAWLAAEAAWRSLQTILVARGARSATRIELCEARRAEIADLLESAAFAEAMAGDALRAILVLGAYRRSDKDLQDLHRLAEVAEALATPVIVSLDQDFFGAAPESVSVMDNPAALLDGHGYEAWRGLRGRDGSQWIFAAWNDFVLRPESAAAPCLWGEPGVIIAAQILRSLARVGWPTEILGAETALGGLDVVEVGARGGRRVAIPLRALMDLGVARDLAREGVISLVCRADRDQVWITRASSLHAGGAAPMEDKAAETLAGLPFRFVSTHLETLLRASLPDLAAAGAQGVGGERIAQRLENALLPTGAGASARVTALPGESDGARPFEVVIQLGRSVMGGFAFSLEIEL